MDAQFLHQNLYRSLVDEAMPDAVFVHDEKGRFVDVNVKACTSLGYSRDELLAMHVPDIELDFESLQATTMWARMQPGHSEVLRGRHRRKDGTCFPVELHIALLKTDDTRLYLAVAHDTSAWVAQEEALRKSEAEFRRLFDTMSEGYCVYEVIDSADSERVDLRYLMANPAFESHTGRKREDVIGCTVRSLYPDVESAWIARLAAVALDGESTHYQSYFAPLGRWFELIAFQTQPMQVGIVFFDVTERKRLEQRLRMQAQVFDNIEEGIVITDSKGLVVDANPSFERITEYSREELLGRNLKLLKSGKQEDGFYQDMWRSILEKGSWSGEIWNRRKSGDIFLQWESITCLRDAAGEIKNYIGVAIDLSRMRHARSELERLAHHDALTGLPNRLALLTSLAAAVERTRRFAKLGAVLFMDLDHFKEVNDTLGHACGDELLQSVAQRVRGRLRDIDILARLGGDEFVVLLADLANRSAAVKVAEDLVAQLGCPFVLGNGETVQVGISIGIAMFPEDGVDPAKLLKQADHALYIAKREGRGCYRFVTHQDNNQK